MLALERAAAAGEVGSLEEEKCVGSTLHEWRKGGKAKFVAEVSRLEERIKELVYVRAERSSAVEKQGLKCKHGVTEAHDPEDTRENGCPADNRALGALGGMCAVFPLLSYSSWLTHRQSQLVN